MSLTLLWRCLSECLNAAVVENDGVLPSATSKMSQVPHQKGWCFVVND